MANASILPPTTNPEELAKHLGASPRTVAEKVRELGCYRKIGSTVVMLAEDVETFLEATRPCRSKSTSAERSGTTGERLPEGDFAALQARLTKPSRSGSRRKPKPENGDVISMGRARS